MKSIKIYLLPLFLLVFFGTQAFSQINFKKETYNKEHKFSKADSVLVGSYLTESDYNEKYGIDIVDVYEVESLKSSGSDEIYNDTTNHRRNSKNRVLDAGTVSFIVDVAIHTAFLIAAFWQ